jgi:hypothetical protein
MNTSETWTSKQEQLQNSLNQTVKGIEFGESFQTQN